MFRKTLNTCYTPSMNLLSVSRLARSAREGLLFSQVTFGIDEGEKVALIGHNGSGKSTLLACIAGLLDPDQGQSVINKEAGCSFLPQNPVFRPEDSILDHVFSSNSPSLSVIRDYRALCDRLATQENLSATLSDTLARVTHRMDEGNLWNWEYRIESILTSLGITDLSRKMGELSGGMLKKVSLAQVLVEDTRLLLMDEPTNHLDIETIAWLENYLCETERSVLMVTHDRYFLDAVCTSIYELDNRVLTRYEGNFSRYLEKKQIEEEIAANTETRIESVLRTEREWLMRGPQARGTKARARVDAIRKMINRDKREVKTEYAFEVTGRRMGGKVLTAEGLSKSFPVPGGTKTVIKDFSWTFTPGERIGIFGSNGSGKTTLLNLLSGELEPDQGIVSRGETMVFGYYRQNPELSFPDQTVLEYIQDTAELIRLADGRDLTASQLLERFGFTGKVQHSPVATLSGGEKKRVYLVRILMSNPNFLILDEPTNDFDIYTMGVLESFLSGYKGCLLVVSHDRFFMDRVAETLFILDDEGTIRHVPFSTSDYLSYRAAEEAERTQKIAAEKRNRPIENTAISTDSLDTKPKKRSFKEQKEFEQIETRIAEMEEQKGAMEALLSGGESDHQKIRTIAEEYEKLSRELESAYERWEHLASLC